ncbi:MAG: Rieske 2Fe-2S domain-containing protein [Acidimicrobiales bacterium]
MFARNHWYVAALTGEITGEPLARTVLGDRVVLYRTASGRAVALADRCPHRRFPLSLGSISGETLVCGYHGFTFDCEGGCVAVPGQDRVPSRARVRSYPLAEQGAWTWIWMGDPDRPDRSRLPDVPWLVEGGQWRVLTDMAPLAARVELLMDNLMDLSHESYLHAGSIGTPEVAETPIETSVDEAAAVVRVDRHIADAACPAFYSRSTGIEGRIDRWQDIEYFAPGYYLLHSRIAPVGVAPEPDGSDPRGFHMKISYGLTPSTETTSYDFWAVSRDFAGGDAEVDETLAKLQASVVDQDVRALDALEERVAADPDPFEINVRIDRGGLAARRLVEGLVAAESAK